MSIVSTTTLPAAVFFDEHRNAVIDLLTVTGHSAMERWPWIRAELNGLPHDQCFVLPRWEKGQLMGMRLWRESPLGATNIAPSVPMFIARTSAALGVLVDTTRAIAAFRHVALDCDADSALESLMIERYSSIERTTVGVPALVVDTATRLLSHGMVKQLRHAHNRLVHDGVTQQTRIIDSVAGAQRLIPEMQRIHLSRDHVRRHVSDLDDAWVRRRWQSLLIAHAESDELMVVVLELDGVMVSYVAAVLDSPVVRVIDGHCSVDALRYSPGRLVEAHLLELMASMSDFHTIDWMNSVARSSLLASNADTTYVRLSCARP